MHPGLPTERLNDIPDVLQRGNVLPVSGPHTDTRASLAPGQNCTIDLRLIVLAVTSTVVQVFSNHGKQEQLPHIIHPTGIILCLKSHDPLSALFVRSVLPHGLDAVLEHVVIGAELQVVGSLNMVVGAPEVFHLFVKQPGFRSYTEKST